jgi:hypothetical protein
MGERTRLAPSCTIALIAALAACAACGGVQAEPSERAGRLAITCQPACLVYVDDVATARVELPATLRLAPRLHRVRAEADGMLPMRFDVAIARDETISLDIVLWPALDPDAR